MNSFLFLGHNGVTGAPFGLNLAPSREGGKP